MVIIIIWDTEAISIFLGAKTRFSFHCITLVLFSWWWFEVYCKRGFMDYYKDCQLLVDWLFRLFACTLITGGWRLLCYTVFRLSAAEVVTLHFADELNVFWLSSSWLQLTFTNRFINVNECVNLLSSRSA